MLVTQIQKMISGLPAKERAKLAVWLLDSLPSSSDEDAAADSVAKAIRRRNELDSGNAKPLSAKAFWAEIERERSQ
jgi:hypothetical protein